MAKKVQMRFLFSFLLLRFAELEHKQNNSSLMRCEKKLLFFDDNIPAACDFN